LVVVLEVAELRFSETDFPWMSVSAVAPTAQGEKYSCAVTTTCLPEAQNPLAGKGLIFAGNILQW
jgi:hypothetical protein